MLKSKKKYTSIQAFSSFMVLFTIQKKQIRRWLWKKVREPKIKKMYSPNYLIENLGDKED